MFLASDDVLSVQKTSEPGNEGVGEERLGAGSRTRAHGGAYYEDSLMISSRRSRNLTPASLAYPSDAASAQVPSVFQKASRSLEGSQQILPGS